MRKLKMSSRIFLFLAVGYFLSVLVFVLTPHLILQTNAWHHPTPTPTPSTIPTVPVTPTAVPTLPVSINTSSSNNAGASGALQGSTTNPPSVATCNIAYASPILQSWSYGPVPGSLTFGWWPSTDKGVTQQALVYGYSLNKLIYGVLLPSTSGQYTIEDLAIGKPIWVEVWALKNGCAEKSKPLDP